MKKLFLVGILALASVAQAQLIPQKDNNSQQVQGPFIPPGCRPGISCTAVPLYGAVYLIPAPVVPTNTPVGTLTPTVTPTPTATYNLTNTITPTPSFTFTPPAVYVAQPVATLATPTQVATCPPGLILDCVINDVSSGSTTVGTAKIFLGIQQVFYDNNLVASSSRGGIMLRGDGRAWSIVPDPTTPLNYNLSFPARGVQTPVPLW